jgi:hypothetical protein
MDAEKQTNIFQAVEYLRENVLPTIRSLPKRIESHVRRFSIHMRGQLRRKAHIYQKALRRVRMPDDAISRRGVLRHSVLLARAEVVRDRIGVILAVITLSSLIGVPRLLFTYANGAFARHLGIAAIDGDDIPGALLGMFFLFLIMFPPLPTKGALRLLIGSGEFRRAWSITIAAGATVIAISALPDATVVAWSLLTPLAIVFTLEVIAAMESHFESRIAREYSEQYPLECLLRARGALTKSMRRLESIGARSAASRHVQAAARHITHQWPRQLRQLDRETGSWFQSQCRNLASHVASVGRNILWADSLHTNSRDEIDKLISAFVCGTLVELANDPLPALAGAKRRAYLDDLRGVVIGFMPLGALALWRLGGFSMPEHIRQWSAFGAYIWALVALLAVLDPLLERRINMSRGILDYLKGLSP